MNVEKIRAAVVYLPDTQPEFAVAYRAEDCCIGIDPASSGVVLRGRTVELARTLLARSLSLGLHPFALAGPPSARLETSSSSLYRLYQHATAARALLRRV